MAISVGRHNRQGGNVGESQNLWKPEYMFDIDVIDEQHKGFSEICLKSSMLCEMARTKPIQLPDVIHLIYGMRAYAFKHFHTEETLLLKYGYPKFYDHIRQHDIFLSTMQKFIAELHEHLAKTQSAGQEVFLAYAKHINDYLANWWAEHILNVDQEYMQYIREHKGLNV